MVMNYESFYAAGYIFLTLGKKEINVESDE